MTRVEGEQQHPTTTSTLDEQTAAAVEITALVIEFGSSVVRMGHAGDDQPRLVFPSLVGRRASREGAIEELVVGEAGLAALSPSTPITSITPVIDGARVLDWPGLKSVWKFGLKRLGFDTASDDSDGTAHLPPVILVMHVAFQQREELLRMAFGLGHSAAFLTRHPVMAAFGAGRHSGVIVDLGEEGVRVCAVQEGYALLGTFQENRRLGGRFLTDQCRLLALNAWPGKGISREQVEELVLDCLASEIREKEPVDLRCVPLCTRRSMPRGLALSGPQRTLQRRRLLEDLKESVMAVSDLPDFNPAKLALRTPLYYEFPCGFNVNVGLERFQLAEQLFDTSGRFLFEGGEEGESRAGIALLPSSEISSGGGGFSLPEMVIRSIAAIDTEQRSTHQTLILTGGGAMLPALPERLSSALNLVSPGTKVRIYAGSTAAGGLAASIERKHGAWIGASALGCLGSFQSLWCTRAEFQSAASADLEAFISKKFPS